MERERVCRLWRRNAENKREGREMRPTNEEELIHVWSIRKILQIPQLLYHIQWKFRLRKTKI